MLLMCGGEAFQSSFRGSPDPKNTRHLTRRRPRGREGGVPPACRPLSPGAPLPRLILALTVPDSNPNRLSQARTRTRGAPHQKKVLVPSS